MWSLYIVKILLLLRIPMQCLSVAWKMAMLETAELETLERAVCAADLLPDTLDLALCVEYVLVSPPSNVISSVSSFRH